MGYNEAISHSWFKKTEDGKTLFYPYGIFGKGYELSPSEEQIVKQFLLRFNVGALPVITLSVIFFGWYAIIPTVSLILYYLVRVKKLLSTSKESNEKITTGENAMNMARLMGVKDSLVLALLSAIMFGVSLYIVFGIGTYSFMGIFTLLFFGAGLLLSIFFAWRSVKIRLQRRDT
ncbi:MAG: hypothetical protein HYS86_05575 [Candidatus Chisholmbacteria bacterium]|nr:hypothetical protein [Candidatus Chisholmbacteria bacterium]